MTDAASAPAPDSDPNPSPPPVPPPEPATRRLTPKGARRRQDLMDFAAHLFATEGYHTTSVTGIVDGLGVGKGVFYWYFDSKDKLLRQEILINAQPPCGSPNGTPSPTPSPSTIPVTDVVW